MPYVRWLKEKAGKNNMILSARYATTADTQSHHGGADFLSVWRGRAHISDLCFPLMVLSPTIQSWWKGFLSHRRAARRRLRSLLNAAKLVHVLCRVFLRWSPRMASPPLPHSCLLSEMQMLDISSADLPLCILMSGSGFQLRASREIRRQETRSKIKKNNNNNTQLPFWRQICKLMRIHAFSLRLQF